jgi:hypothetical protein
MRTKVKELRIGLTVALVIGLVCVARDASALLDNVPYVANGRTLTAQAGTAGDATYFNNLFFFGYIAPDGNVAILADSNLGSSGQSVVYSYEIATKATDGVALAVDNGTLYLFYVQGYGSSGYTGLAMITSTDGVHWSPEDFFSYGAVGGGTGEFGAPTAVVWDGQVLLYISELGYHLEQYNISGTSTSGPYITFGNYETYSTPTRPSATVWQGRLEVAFTDAANGNEIGLISYTDATGWSSEVLTGVSGIPDLFPLAAGALNMVYRPSNDHIYSTFTSNGVTFSTPQEDTASTTYHAPIQFSNWGLSANWVFYIGENNELFTVLEN